MTLPFERARAVRHTQKFLIDLCDPKKTPRVPKAYRDQARSLLRHYPTLSDLENVARGWNPDVTIVDCPFTTHDDMFGDLT